MSSCYVMEHTVKFGFPHHGEGKTLHCPYADIHAIPSHLSALFFGKHVCACCVQFDIIILLLQVKGYMDDTGINQNEVIFTTHNRQWGGGGELSPP